MEGKGACFFKVIMPGFHQKLNLPPAFCKKLELKKSEEEAVLKSCKGSWKIKMCRNSQGLICFKQGWPQFVHHHTLSIGDFLVFQHTAHSLFHVSVFDPSCCEKDFVKKHPRKESVPDYNSKNPYFMLTKKPNPGPLTIPAEFLRSNDLKKKTSIILRDPRGVRWAPRLLVYPSRYRMRIGSGWYQFCVSNQLKVGDVFVFDLNPHSTSSSTMFFDVKIFPKK